MLVLPKHRAEFHYLFTGLARDAARGLAFDRVVNMYAPIFWPDIVFYFSVSAETSGQRIAAERKPSFYEAGQDVTGEADSLASYRDFIQRAFLTSETRLWDAGFVAGVLAEPEPGQPIVNVAYLAHEGQGLPATERPGGHP